MRFGLALRAFWKALTDRGAAEQLALALDKEDAAARLDAPSSPKPELAAPEKPAASLPTQNPAITLLASLQRDARLIDLIHENLDQYEDAQVGAAARPCLKQCRQTLDRLLQIQPLLDASENDTVALDGDASPARYRWVGESQSGENAKLVHPGWKASKIELPQWTGEKADAEILAPAQLTEI